MPARTIIVHKPQLQRACPVCRNATRAEILHTQTFVLPDNHILPCKYDVVACSACGFVYIDTAADQAVYDKYYSDMSKYETTYINADTKLFSARAEWISKFFHSANPSIVDVGCGNGQLLSELNKLGFSDLTAIDPSQKCIDIIRAKGINGIVGSIFQVSTAKLFDGVILSGVLEHICDVPRIMDKIKSLTKTGGLFFVFVPDASRYQDYDSVPYDYLNIEHLNHFDETSLINLGLLHGLRTVGFLKTTITLSRAQQPVIFCVYKNEFRDIVNWKNYSKDSFSHYLAGTEKNIVANRIIDELVASKEEVIVWGAGNYTARLLATSNLCKCKIIMFVDNDKHKQGTSICSKPIYAPDAILKVGKKPAILIAAAVFYDEIINQLKSMGINDHIKVLK